MPSKIPSNVPSLDRSKEPSSAPSMCESASSDDSFVENGSFEDGSGNNDCSANFKNDGACKIMTGDCGCCNFVKRNSDQIIVFHGKGGTGVGAVSQSGIELCPDTKYILSFFYSGISFVNGMVPTTLNSCSRFDTINRRR